MGKRLALVGLAFLLPHCADAYTGAPLGSDGPGGGSVDGGAGGASSVRLVLEPVPDIIVDAGASVAVPITITRNGVTGPVVVAVTGLPAGVDAPEVTVAESSASLTVSVAKGSSFPPAMVTLTATSGAESVSRKTTLLLRGKPGSMDESFGVEGVVANVLGASRGAASDLAFRPDGSYVILANGAESAFLAPVPREGGVASDVLPLPFAVAGALAAEPGGAVVVGGRDAKEPDTMVLRRFRPADLAADEAFGSAGRTVLGKSGVGGVGDLLFQNGRFLAFHDGTGPAVSAVTTAGALDTGWGSAGTARTTGMDALSLVPYGTGQVAFSFDTAAYGYATSVVTAAGTASTRGLVEAAQGGYDPAQGPRGAGSATTACLPVADRSGGYGFLLSTGAMNVVRTVPVDVTSPGLAAVLPADGKVVLVFAPLRRIALGRFDARTGSRDPTFGATGLVGVPIEDVSSVRIYLQPDGRLVGFANVETAKVPAVSMFRVWL